MLQVVVEGDGDDDLLALGDGWRQVEVEEKVLKDDEVVSGDAQLALPRGGQRREPPGGDVVGQRQVERQVTSS